MSRRRRRNPTFAGADIETAGGVLGGLVAAGVTDNMLSPFTAPLAAKFGAVGKMAKSVVAAGLAHWALSKTPFGRKTGAGTAAYAGLGVAQGLGLGGVIPITVGQTSLVPAGNPFAALLGPGKTDTPAPTIKAPAVNGAGW